LEFFIDLSNFVEVELRAVTLANSNYPELRDWIGGWIGPMWSGP